MSKELQRRIFELTLALYRVTDFFPESEILRKQLRQKANEIFAEITESLSLPDLDREMMLVLGKIDTIRGFLEIARSMNFVRPINIMVLEREYSFLASLANKEVETLRQKNSSSAHPPSHAKVGDRERAPADAHTDRGSLSTWDEFAARAGKGQSPSDVLNTRDMINREKTSAVSKPVPRLPKEDLLKEKISSNPHHSSENINERQKLIVGRLRARDRAKISDFFSFFQGISSKTIQRDLQDLVSRNILHKEGEKRWTVYSLKRS